MPIIITPRKNLDLSYYWREVNMLTQDRSNVDQLRPRWFDPMALGIDFGSLNDQEKKLIQGFHLQANDRRSNRAIELVFPAPKWLSVSVAIAAKPDRDRIIAAHRQAVSVTLKQVLDEFVWVKRTRSGCVSYEKGDAFGAVEFTHLISRSMDPHLHSHVLLANSALDASGGARAIPLLPMQYGSEAFTLTYFKRLGYELNSLEACKPIHSFLEIFPSNSNQDASLFQVSKALASTGIFSTRTKDITDALDKRGFTSSRARKIASISTRNEKPTQSSLEELCYRWRAMSSSRGDLYVGNAFTLQEHLLQDEIDAVEKRLLNRANENGLDYSTLASLNGDLTDQFQGGKAGHAEHFLLDEQLLNLTSENNFSAFEVARPCSFRNIPIMERIYPATVVRDFVETLQKSPRGTLGPYFQIMSKDSDSIVLEDYLRAARGKSLFRCHDDPGITPNTVGKTVFNSLWELPLEGYRNDLSNKVILASPSLDPVRVRELIRDSNKRVTLVVVDKGQTRIGKQNELQKISGRGSGWRTLLAANSTTCLNLDLPDQGRLAPPITLRLDSADVRVFASTSQMMATVKKDVDQKRVTDPCWIGDQVFAHEKKALQINENSVERLFVDPTLAPIMKRYEILGQQDRTKIFNSAKRVEHLGADLGTSNTVANELESKSCASGLKLEPRASQVSYESPAGDTLQFLKESLDCTSSPVRAVIQRKDGIELQVVAPIMQERAYAEDRVLAKRALNTLGFFQDSKFLPKQTSEAEILDAPPTGSPREISEISISELFEDNNSALRRDISADVLTSNLLPKPVEHRLMLTSTERIELNKRLLSVITSPALIPNKTESLVDPAKEGTPMLRLSSMLEELEQENSRNSRSLAGGRETQWLIEFSSQMLKRAARERHEVSQDKGLSFSVRGQALERSLRATGMTLGHSMSFSL